MRRTSYKPDVVFNDCLRTSLDGTVHTLNESSCADLFFLDPAELTPPGIRKAAESARKRIMATDNYSVADGISPLNMFIRDFDHAMRQHDLLLAAEDFQQQNRGFEKVPNLKTLREIKGADHAFDLFSKTYPDQNFWSLIAQSGETGTSFKRKWQTERQKYFYEKLGLAPKQISGMDDTFVKYDDHSFSSQEEMRAMQSLLKRSLEHIDKHPEEYLSKIQKSMADMPENYCKPLKKVISDGLQKTIAKLPPRVKDFLEYYNPTFIIANSAPLPFSNKPAPLTITMGGFYPGQNIIYIRTGREGDINTVSEEVAHLIQCHIVGCFETRSFAAAFEKDMLTPQAKIFFDRWAHKKTADIEQSYDAKDRGHEWWAEMPKIELALTKSLGLDPAAAQQSIADNLPESGKLYLDYCQREDALWERIQAEKTRERLDCGFQAKSEKNKIPSSSRRCNSNGRSPE